MQLTYEKSTSDNINHTNDNHAEGNLNEIRWNGMYEALVQFNSVNNHSRVPVRYTENPQLGKWVGTQRTLKDRLTKERVRKLDSVGFDWNPKSTAWNEMYEALMEFRLINNHCNVPQTYVENPKLGNWVNRQRIIKSTLSDDRIQKLNAIGFEWNQFDSVWNEMYDELVQYNLDNNHCNVPQSYIENPKLGRWVSQQRVLKDKLSEERIQKLNELGFGWSPIENYWNEMYEALLQFKSENSHCNVPQLYKINVRLSNWVSTQRTSKSRKILSEDKIQKLNDIGFVWKIR